MKASLLLFFVTAIFVTTLRGAAPTPTPPANDKFRLSDLLPRGLQKNPLLNLSIITEMTKEGKRIPTPSKDHPGYYLVWDGGLVEEGDVVAGEKPPPPAILAQLMKSSLEGSGYEPASNKNTPTLVIHYRWGVFNHLTAMSAEGDSEDQVRTNLMTRAALVGGVPFSIDLMRAINNRTLNFFRNRDIRTDSLVTMAVGDLYFLIASAYEYEAATHGQMKLLWTTKLSTDSHGLAMDDALPSLVLSAKTYFGHETNGPVVFHPRLYQGHVDLGEPTVAGYIENPTTQSGTVKPAKKTR